MSINALTPNVDSLTYKKVWLRTIRDHRTILLRRDDTVLIDVEPSLMVATERDIHGFLLSVGIGPDYHDAIKIINGLENPDDFVNIASLYIVSDAALSDIRKKIKTTYV